MSTQTLEQPTGTLQNEQVEHYVCGCTLDLAMCGARVDICDPTIEGLVTCGACISLNNFGPWACPKCGCQPQEYCSWCGGQ